MSKVRTQEPEGFTEWWSIWRPIARHTDECSVDGCGEPAHRSCKYCCSHYYRLRKYGDVNGGVRKKSGFVQKYYRDVVLKYVGDECLIWPHAKNGGGYPQLAVKGRMKDLHRIICKEVNGEPPTDKHEAAHTCGNKACVNRSHLQWKTPVENAADKYIHGTIMFGERNGSAKLTDEQVKEIRENSYATNQTLADLYHVSVSHISRIRNFIQRRAA